MVIDDAAEVAAVEYFEVIWGGPLGSSTPAELANSLARVAYVRGMSDGFSQR